MNIVAIESQTNQKVQLFHSLRLFADKDKIVWEITTNVEKYRCEIHEDRYNDLSSVMEFLKGQGLYNDCIYIQFDNNRSYLIIGFGNNQRKLTGTLKTIKTKVEAAQPQIPVND